MYMLYLKNRRKLKDLDVVEKIYFYGYIVWVFVFYCCGGYFVIGENI